MRFLPLLLVLICAAVPVEELASTLEQELVIRSVWSLLLCAALYSCISTRRLVVILCCEFWSIVYNLAIALGYYFTDSDLSAWYAPVMIALLCIEIVAVLPGRSDVTAETIEVVAIVIIAGHLMLVSWLIFSRCRWLHANISDISSAGSDPMWHLILHSKAFTVTATTSAITYLTAYSTDIGQAAQAVPQVINFIGTHGPIQGKSWADVMAFFSFLLVITNLIIGLQKIASGIRDWFKKPKRKGRR